MPFALEQLTQALSIQAVCGPQALSAATINSGNGVDISRFRRLLAIILVGAGGGSVKAQFYAATTSGGAFTALGAAINNITTASKQASIEVRDDELQSLIAQGYRWVQLQVTENGVASTQVAAVVLGGEGDWKPASLQDPASVVQRLVL